MHHVHIIISMKVFHYFQMDNVKGLRLMYLNIRSLYKHLDDFFLNFGEYDIMCLGETWLRPTIPDNCISHSEYTMFRQDRVEKARGGGVVTYLKSYIGKYAHTVSEYSISDPHIELLWTEINVPNHKKMVVVNVYRPPLEILPKQLNIYEPV